MAWHAQLDIDYSSTASRTVARHRHQGPLRVLQSLYPEGEAICHNVLVHPPGGIVGGDTLELAISAAAGSHGLVTTPGATRFYRSQGEWARQHTRIRMDAGSRLEWLPQEAICYDGCLAENRLQMQLAPGAELIGWDVTALGLPAAGQPLRTGRLLQHIELAGHWLERGRVDADDTRLLHGPLGLAGHACMATIFFCGGEPLRRDRAQQLLDGARAVIDSHALASRAGASSPNDHVVLVRVLAPLVEPAMALLRQVRVAWREHAWQLTAQAPRIWST
ncbi:urease accessory protein UreD [Comamonadaceae bacterium G21597-S1]|nr:urease accessory protein UreD [Comamonadaceae bacterium G21597-S1]